MTKRSRIYSSNGSSTPGNEEYLLSQGKCSFCGNSTPPTYYCLKCQQLFHNYCGNFRVENDKAGICGNCLISIILECPCCHQRGFKGIHGLRTHIGGYCKKQHAKDWRQHFKEFFAQLTQRLDSIPNRDISALSIIRSHRQMANAVAKFYGCADDSYYKDSDGHDFESNMTLTDYINQVQRGENTRLRKPVRYNDGREVVVTNTQANPLPTLQRATSVTNSVSIEEMGNNYNLRRKSSLVSGNAATHAADDTASQTSSQSLLEKNNPLNTVLLDCPFCEKAGCQGLPGIRTHIRNYCPSVDKSIWREKLIKCVKYNIKKYEDMNKLPNANTEYNNQVINLLKTKTTLESDCLTGRAKNGLSKGGMKELTVSLGSMNPMSYEKLYCEHCHDENSYCPFCGCHTCHYKHIAPLLLICDSCNREHHLYCINPPLDSIPEGSWYCPDCQKKNHVNSIYMDTNFAFSFKSLSEQAANAVNICLPFVRNGEPQYDTLLSSLTMADLLQLQSCKV